MSNARRIRNIALVGFMGTGKSSAGRVVADFLKFDFVDTDELIEARAGKSISRIFSENGEAAFRELEHAVSAELQSRERLVISTGGGFAADAANLEALKRHALVVCLWASPETIHDRVRGQNNRPLLQTSDPLARIGELLRQREPIYRQADVLIGTEMRSIREVALHVLHQFQIATRHSAA